MIVTVGRLVVGARVAGCLVVVGRWVVVLVVVRGGRVVGAGVGAGVGAEVVGRNVGVGRAVVGGAVISRITGNGANPHVLQQVLA